MSNPSIGGAEADLPPLSRTNKGILWAAILAADLGGFWFFWARGLTNLYGDGIAHVEGARRIFDSLTPGLPEIGSVWLPLQHLLAAPLAINDTLWRTGLAGSFISVTAFAFTAAILFRFSREMNRSLAAAWVTLAFFLISLNMLYAASTPLTEPLAVFWAALVAYALFRFQQSARTSICIWAAVAAFFGALTRYDGWYLIPFAALFILLCRQRNWRSRIGQTLTFCLISGAAPVLWLLHNAIRYGNPLQFYNGPYSAKAIYARQIATTAFRYPTDGSLWMAAHYYLEDIKLLFGPWTLAFATLGFLAWIVDRKLRSRRAAALLLLVPLVFYTQSMAYGSVAIYVPTLPPHTYYNVRYGLEMAPAMAIFPSFLLPRSGPPRPRYVVPAILCIVLLLQAAAMAWRGARGVVLVEESILNTPCKTESEQETIKFFRQHYDGQDLLIVANEWPCLMPQVGIPYRKTLGPRNRKYWRRIRFGARCWVGWIVSRRGDAVDQLMRAYPEAFADFELVKREPLPHHEMFLIYRRRDGR